MPGQHVRADQRGAEHRRVLGVHGACDDQGAGRAEQRVGVRVRQRVLCGGDEGQGPGGYGGVCDVSAGGGVQRGQGVRLARPAVDAAGVRERVCVGGQLEPGCCDGAVRAGELPVGIQPGVIARGPAGVPGLLS